MTFSDDTVRRCAEMVRSAAVSDMAIRIQAGELSAPDDRREWDRMARESAGELAAAVERVLA